MSFTLTDVIGIKSRAMVLGGPQAPCGLVGQRHGSLVVTLALGQIQRPSLGAIERAAAFPGDVRSGQCGTCTVDQERAQIHIAAFGDPPEFASAATGIFRRGAGALAQAGSDMTTSCTWPTLTQRAPGGESLSWVWAGKRPKPRQNPALIPPKSPGQMASRGKASTRQPRVVAKFSKSRPVRVESGWMARIQEHVKGNANRSPSAADPAFALALPAVTVHRGDAGELSELPAVEVSELGQQRQDGGLGKRGYARCEPLEAIGLSMRHGRSGGRSASSTCCGGFLSAGGSRTYLNPDRSPG